MNGRFLKWTVICQNTIQEKGLKYFVHQMVTFDKNRKEKLKQIVEAADELLNDAMLNWIVHCQVHFLTRKYHSC